MIDTANLLDKTQNEYRSRFQGAEWFNELSNQNIIVGGAGGISSWVILLLSRLQPNSIIVYDNDIIESVNISGQLFSIKDIKKFKVESIFDTCVNFSDYYINYYTKLYKKDSLIKKVMICGFDNMEARRIFFNNWLYLAKGRSDCLFIDGRLAAEEFQIFAFTGDDSNAIERYRNEFLFSDEEGNSTICSFKQTSHIASMIASYMVTIYTNFLSNLHHNMYIRNIPFMIFFNAQTLTTVEK